MEDTLNLEVEEPMVDEKQAGERTANATKGMRDRKEGRNFICGVIEGFYGRPWTTEQRKDLFRKMKKWGMDSYVYAPKDDYKHRAYWRELYTVEEADHLTSLITAAREHDVMFYYALSPGLDMSYSSPKEIQTLKRKLDQVSQFGCEAFALLFDDIDSELSKVDKEAFQTFANAQVSVTNEIFTHLGNPRFLFCPTQYCSTRAIPTVHDSEYLNTLGSKLNHDIDIMWTGNKVISKIISLESIQEITEILRRPPVIWDNLHANDYDQKRVFLGPYSGRSPELIPHLRGVMTNPNCEFHANTIAIHTLASWSQCSLDSKVNSSISADIKLETENEDGTNEEELPVDCLSKNMYHPRIALKNAIDEWLPEFFVAKEAWGPITKPQPQVTMVMPIIPIIPSINTCMSLTTTTTTSTSTKTVTVPEVNTTQLQALADVCSTVNSSVINPMSNPVMNSLVSPTKVVTNDDIVNPIPTCVASNIELPKKIPISIVAVPIMHSKAVEDILPRNLDTEVEILKSPVSPLKLTTAITKPIPVAIESSSALTKANLIEANSAITTVSADNVNKEDEMSIEKALSLTAESPIVDMNHEKKMSDVLEGVDATIEKAPELSIDTSATTRDIVNSTGALPMVDEHTLSPLSAISASGNEPMECSSSLASQASGKEDRKMISEDVVMAEGVEDDDICNGSMNELNNSMQVESSEGSPLSNADMKDYDDKNLPEPGSSSSITVEDLYLLCDLFYLPFEHGNRGFKLLNEFNWLKANSSVLLGNDKAVRKCSNADGAVSPKPEVAEWMQRAESFSNHCNSVHELLRKIANCANKEICHDLFSYVWDIAGTLTLLNAFVKWLSLGHFPPNVQTYTQGTYTWFSKGWKEAFMSGDQEPWVFRGGLIADLQRLMPVDSGNDLFLYKLPELPTSDYHLIRPYTPIDEAELGQVCTQAFLQLSVNCADDRPAEFCFESLFPDHLSELIADNIVGHFVTLYPQLCIVAHDASNSIVGYAAAALNIHTFMRNVEICWIPTMREKYAESLLEDKFFDVANGSTESVQRHSTVESSKLKAIFGEMIRDFHNYEYQCPTEVSNAYPALLTAAVLKDALLRDYGLLKRLITVTLATLRSNGCFGVHVRLSLKDSEVFQQHYAKIGFAEVYRDPDNKFIYLGRRF